LGPQKGGTQGTAGSGKDGAQGSAKGGTQGKGKGGAQGSSKGTAQKKNKGLSTAQKLTMANWLAPDTAKPNPTQKATPSKGRWGLALTAAERQIISGLVVDGRPGVPQEVREILSQVLANDPAESSSGAGGAVTGSGNSAAGPLNPYTRRFLKVYNGTDE